MKIIVKTRHDIQREKEGKREKCDGMRRIIAGSYERIWSGKKLQINDVKM